MITAHMSAAPTHYKITHTTTYSSSDVVPLCHNEVRLSPRETERQACYYSRLLVKPTPARQDRRVDYFGNQTTSFMVQEGHQKLQITAISKVSVAEYEPPPAQSTPAWDTIPDRVRNPDNPELVDAAQYLFASPHIPLLPELSEYALVSFTPRRPLLEALSELTTRIFQDFAYDPTATVVNTTLEEVLELRRGVCQDFAHLQIGCLRSVGLPARYVSGYLRTIPPPGKPRLVGADASHAWLAVYCPGHGWIHVDPTNDKIVSSDHITLAWGRDYSDVCPIKGVFVGGGDHGMTVSVDVLPLDTE